MTGEIEVSERGDAITLPERGFAYELSVRTGDPSAQIEVLNDRFQTKVRAAGSFDQKLPAGIYKVRVGRGASAAGFVDRLVVLDRSVNLSIDTPPLSSPAPIAGSRASEGHVAALKQLDEEAHVSLGTGSKIGVLARYGATTQGATPLLHPFRGLQLLRADGQLLIDLEQSTPRRQVTDYEDPISVCGISAEPGYYILRHQLANGRELRQSIVASEGWQITINIRRAQSDVGPDKAEFVGAGYMALLMRRLRNSQAAKPSEIVESKDGSIDEDRLIDVARQALADGEPWLRGNLYDLLLRDFNNPLAGIIGGLLLDVERELAGGDFARQQHAELFDGVVRKLRTLLGHKHPDVEALSFRCLDPHLAHQGPIEARPMFYRSWRIILDLLPLDLWKGSIASGAMPPYLVWSDVEAAKQARYEHLRRVAAALSTQRLTRLGLRAPGERDGLARAQIAAEVGVPASALADLMGKKVAPRTSSRGVEAKATSTTVPKGGGRPKTEGVSKRAEVEEKASDIGGGAGARRMKSGRKSGTRPDPTRG